MACEGRLVVFVAEADAERALEALPAGAARIGRVEEGPAGTQRLLDSRSGEQLPRVC